MDNQTTASTEADTRAIAAVEQHHAAMATTLVRLVDDLLSSVAHGSSATTAASRHELVRWCRAELVPHALAEERTMYPAGHGIEAGRLLVDGMLEEHKVIVGLVDEVEHADNLVAAAAAAKALSTLFDLHLGKENDLLLPLLAATHGVSVAELLGGMHELIGARNDEQEHHRLGFGHHSREGTHHSPAT